MYVCVRERGREGERERERDRERGREGGRERESVPPSYPNCVSGSVLMEFPFTVSESLTTHAHAHTHTHMLYDIQAGRMLICLLVPDL